MGDARKPELANRYNLLAVLLDLGSGIGGVVVLAVTISNTCKEALPALLSQILPAGSRRRPRRTNLCSNFAMARAHRPLYRLGTAHLRHPGPTLPPGNGTSVSCELYYFTLVRALPRYPGVAFSRAFSELHAVCAPNLLGAFRSCICGTESPGLGWPRSASTILRWTYIPVCQLRLRLPQRDAA